MRPSSTYNTPKGGVTFRDQYSNPGIQIDPMQIWEERGHQWENFHNHIHRDTCPLCGFNVYLNAPLHCSKLVRAQSKQKDWNRAKENLMREKAELFHRSSLMSGLCALITLGLLCPLTADIKKILKKLLSCSAHTSPLAIMICLMLPKKKRFPSGLNTVGRFFCTYWSGLDWIAWR